MKEEEKVKQITKNEAKKIDPSKVAYFTLSDGTVFIVKENMKQDNQNVPHEQEQIQTTSQNEQINIPTSSQNTQEIQQQENNIGYNISSEGENIQQNSGCNTRLINAQYIGQNTYIQQGPRRQFYKLIEAIPVRFSDIQGVQFMNQNTNSQIYLQRYNNGTYIVEGSSKENLSNYQVNTQTSGINKVCSCGGRIENVESEKKDEEQKVVENEEKVEERVNEQQANEEQVEEKVEEQVNNEQVEEVKVKHTKVCCCPIGNPALREEMEIISPELYEKMKKLKKL